MVVDHAFYIYAAWGIAAMVLIGVTAYTWLSSRSLRKDLARLEAQGIRRRSSASTGERN